jgi:hypothetical protein
MRPTILAIALAVIGVSPPAALVAQHASTAPSGTAHPAPAAPSAPARPSQGDAHGPAAQGHGAVPAAKTTTKKKANEPDMAGVIERIQQRIATEVGAGAAPPSKARPAAGARTTASTPAPVVPMMPRVTLSWRTTLTWPAELSPTAPVPAPPANPILLIWR